MARKARINRVVMSSLNDVTFQTVRHFGSAILDFRNFSEISEQLRDWFQKTEAYKEARIVIILE